MNNLKQFNNPSIDQIIETLDMKRIEFLDNIKELDKNKSKFSGLFLNDKGELQQIDGQCDHEQIINIMSKNYDSLYRLYNSNPMIFNYEEICQQQVEESLEIAILFTISDLLDNLIHEQESMIQQYDELLEAIPRSREQEMRNKLKQTEERLERLEQKFIEFKTDLENNTGKIEQLEENLGSISQDQEALSQKLEELNFSQEEVVNFIKDIDYLSKDMDILKSIIEDSKIDGEQNKILKEISKDPYNSGFYASLRFQLNATYIAASSVQTDIVINSKHGIAGKVGGALKAISSHIPMFGLGINLFGALLTQIDSVNQVEKVKNYAQLASDTTEMAALSKNIAIELIKGGLNKESFKNSQSLQSKLLSILEKCLDIGTDIIKEGASSMEDFSKFSDGGSSNKFGQKAFDGLKVGSITVLSDEVSSIIVNLCQDADRAENESARGNVDGKIVANLIIAKVFSGECDKTTLVQYIKNEFGNDGETLVHDTDLDRLFGKGENLSIPEEIQEEINSEYILSSDSCHSDMSEYLDHDSVSIQGTNSDHVSCCLIM